MITFYGSRYIDDCLPVEGLEVNISGLSRPAIVNNDGMYIFGSDGKKVHGKNGRLVLIVMYVKHSVCLYSQSANVRKRSNLIACVLSRDHR